MYDVRTKCYSREIVVHIGVRGWVGVRVGGWMLEVEVVLDHTFSPLQEGFEKENSNGL